MLAQLIARRSAPSAPRLRSVFQQAMKVAAVFALTTSHAVGAAISAEPVFLLPNTATNTASPYATPRPLSPGYALSGMYFDAGGNSIWQQTGAVLTTAPGSLAWGPSDSSSRTYADPASFDAKSKFAVETDGSANKYAYGSAQVWNWFVLSGSPGQTVSLTADILVQGQVFANNNTGGNAGAIFGTNLTFLSSPSDLTPDYAIAFTGAVNWAGGFSTNNTADADILWDIGTSIHEINYILRSQPFTVTVGVPFRLSMISSAQGFAGPGAWGEAWADFYDPQLVTSLDFPSISQLTTTGFSQVVVDTQGNVTYRPLGDGLSIASIPEPGILALVGFALAGLASSRRRKT